MFGFIYFGQSPFAGFPNGGPVEIFSLPEIMVATTMPAVAQKTTMPAVARKHTEPVIEGKSTENA